MQHDAIAHPSEEKRVSAPAKRYVYSFDGSGADGDASMKALLGGKGANLAEMARIGLPVPPGLTVTTEACTYAQSHAGALPPGAQAEIRAAIARIERMSGRRFGDTTAMPLLVSVRSGARSSMPGMMDTILNLGLNDGTMDALAHATGHERFALDCRRRFVQMYGDVVLGVQRRSGEDDDPFEAVLATVKGERLGDRHAHDALLSVHDLREVVRRFEALVVDRAGRPVPADPWEQLDGAISAVFASWMNDRAVVYRRKYGIPHDWGTAVNVQAMVFGNGGERSGSGVGFTRDPATGERVLYGELLMNAQGEDVVAGVRTPLPIARLREILPPAYDELERMRALLETHFRDVQDFEFTIENGRVWMLQTRSAKRTGLAALRIATEMVDEGLVDWRTAIERVPADELDQLLQPVFDAEALAGAAAIAEGLPAGPGAASGAIHFDAASAARAAARGPVLLVRVETSPDDLRGMIAAAGILTARGGVSSHAALVARQMGKPCVSGASALELDATSGTLRIGDRTFREGDQLSIDGTTGHVYAGALPATSSDVVRAAVHGDEAARRSPRARQLARLLAWCDEAATLEVRANADSPEQTRIALAFGAKGIGLCRTEHMFFETDRIGWMRAMILAATEEERAAALDRLLPLQRGDFAGMFRALQGLPATIRLLDPPLHEFLPATPDQQRALAAELGIDVQRVVARVEELREQNPMLGFRGCRLGIRYPEITAMQARAIFEAAALVIGEGIPCLPEVMVPLVGFARELELQAAIVRAVAADVMRETATTIVYRVGTMIEVPRAALVADAIAETAEFFSFGTNDLTQTTLGMSRDDAGSFLGHYAESDVVRTNPFATIDAAGVGALMSMAVERGRQRRPRLEIGICGEHGGDPESIALCHRLGLDYVSCSPYRVPVARLVAAQAAIAVMRERSS
jgi:pyruvate,orthophosphate dikinase